MSDSTSTPSNPESDQPKAPAPKKRRKWPWVILVIVVLIGLLVVMLPTISGTPMSQLAQWLPDEWKKSHSTPPM